MGDVPREELQPLMGSESVSSSSDDELKEVEVNYAGGMYRKANFQIS